MKKIFVKDLCNNGKIIIKASLNEILESIQNYDSVDDLEEIIKSCKDRINYIENYI